MVLEIIGAAAMIGFGLLAIYFSLENKGAGDQQMIIVLLLGVALVIGGGWIIATRISLAVLLAKLAGIIFLFLGFFLITGFSVSGEYGEYQRPPMAQAGVFIGIVLFIVGFYLLFFFA